MSNYRNLNFWSVLAVGKKFSVHPSVFQIISWLSCSAEQHQCQHVKWPKFEIDFRQNKSLSENKPNPLKLRGCKDWSWLYHLEDFEQVLVSLETSMAYISKREGSWPLSKRKSWIAGLILIVFLPKKRWRNPATLPYLLCISGLCWARPLDSLPHTMRDIIRKFQGQWRLAVGWYIMVCCSV